MKINHLILVIAMVPCAIFTYSQTNNLTGSPYSIFGLGVKTSSNVGKNSGMGNVGLALIDEVNINLFNPASIAEIGTNKFLFDFGLFTELEVLTEDDRNELRLSSNFSNAAIAFPLSEASSLGLSLRPATSVGYTIVGLQNNIEGSNDQFISNIFGSGGLNDLRVDYGRSFSDKLNLGVKASYLFGNIDENETIETETSSLLISETFRYSGFQFSLGAQYKISPQHNLGLILDIESNLSSRKDTFVSSGSNQASLDFIENTENEKSNSFKLPYRVGFGYSFSNSKVTLSADLNYHFWSETNQTDQSGEFINQSSIALGGEFTPDFNSLKYWKRINYRAGLFYDTGNLEIDGDSVENMGLSIGLGLPISSTGQSLINISFTSGLRGSNKNILVQDNFNTLNINLSLSDIWFRKRKIL
ncbi:MAG: hypothetical protein ACWA5P_06340 [bacterium]